MAVYGDKGTGKKSRQTLLFGDPELKWLAREAERLAEEAGGNADAAAAVAKNGNRSFARTSKLCVTAQLCPLA